MAAEKLPAQATGANIRSSINSHADILDDHEERIQTLESSLPTASFPVTSGDITSGTNTKIIAWSTDLVPGDTITYLAKHGSLTDVTVNVEVDNPLPSTPNQKIPGGTYVKFLGTPTTLTIDNQGANAHYIIK